TERRAASSKRALRSDQGSKPINSWRTCSTSSVSATERSKCCTTGLHEPSAASTGCRGSGTDPGSSEGKENAGASPFSGLRRRQLKLDRPLSRCLIERLYRGARLVGVWLSQIKPRQPLAATCPNLCPIPESPYSHSSKCSVSSRM